MVRVLGFAARLAVRPVAALGFAAIVTSCAPEEPVTMAPESSTRTIRAGGSDEIGMSVLMEDSGFQFVALPVDVRFVGLDSDVPPELTLHPDPIEVTLDELESSQDGTLTIGVLPGTAPGEYKARIVPDSTNEFVGGGDGLELTVIVPEGAAIEPTAEPTVEPTEEPTAGPTEEPTVEPTPTGECDPDFEDCG